MALAPHFTVLNYDRRGRGDSGDTAPYAVEREIDDLGALITAAGGSAVFGYSSGATLALKAAASGLPISKTRPGPRRPPCLAGGSPPSPARPTTSTRKPPRPSWQNSSPADTRIPSRARRPAPRGAGRDRLPS
jgi:pimeloyl-ACP methyl ester carboxylesterase